MTRNVIFGFLFSLTIFMPTSASDDNQVVDCYSEKKFRLFSEQKLFTGHNVFP